MQIGHDNVVKFLNSSKANGEHFDIIQNLNTAKIHLPNKTFTDCDCNCGECACCDAMTSEYFVQRTEKNEL